MVVTTIHRKKISGSLPGRTRPDHSSSPRPKPQAGTGHRPRVCYAGIGEFSIYLDRAARGRGVGRQLLDALIGVARERGYWKLVSRIFPFNTASRSLCRSCGFREVGVYEKHAQLDGQWIDVVIVERLILENLKSRGATTTANAHVASEE